MCILWTVSLVVASRSHDARTIYRACRAVVKDGWSDPWLKDEPASKVDASDFLASKVELQRAFVDLGYL